MTLELPPPLPGEGAAARRAANPIPPADPGQSQARRAVEAVLIGIGATVIGTVIFGAILYVILAVVAQGAVSGGH